jgi:hypothetical protein
LLLVLDSLKPWIFRRQRLILDGVPGWRPSDGCLVGCKLDRGQVEGIHVGSRGGRVHHDFVAGHLHGRRVDLVVALGRELAGQLGHKANWVIWDGTAVEEVDFGRWNSCHRGVRCGILTDLGDDNAV